MTTALIRKRRCGQQKFMPRFADENIQETGVSARDKVGNIPRSSFKSNGNGLRPFFVGLGDAPIRLLGLSPDFLARAGTKDTDRLMSMLPFQSLSLSGLEGRKGIYA